MLDDKMALIVRVFIPGKPFSAARPRFSKATGRAVTKGEMKDALEIARWHMLSAAHDAGVSEPMNGLLMVKARFAFSSRKKIEPGMIRFTSIRNDVDNLLKLVLDAGNGILWKDDRQIVHVEATKFESHADETVIEVFS